MNCLIVVAVAAGASGAILRAAALTSRYEAEVRRLRAEWRAAQQAEGLNDRAGRQQLYAKYPTPEITLFKPVVLAPGGTAPLSINGKFPAGTAFVMEHDQVELKAGAITPRTFTATVTAAPDALPAYARLWVYTPVSGAYNRVGAVVVAVAPSYSLTAPNGWTVKLAPTAKAYDVHRDEATIPYKAEYFKPGETTPFETTTGELRLSANDAPASSHTFGMRPGAQGSAMADYEKLSRPLGDGSFLKMSTREQEALMKKIEAVGERMAKEAEAMMADPAAMQKKQDDFGCQSISLTLTATGASGAINCGRNVGTLRVQGTRS